MKGSSHHHFNPMTDLGITNIWSARHYSWPWGAPTPSGVGNPHIAVDSPKLTVFYTNSLLLTRNCTNNRNSQLIHILYIIRVSIYTSCTHDLSFSLCCNIFRPHSTSESFFSVVIDLKNFSNMFTEKKKKLAYKWIHTIQTHVVQGSAVCPWGMQC